MKVLLAGASGAIGRYLVPQLIEANHEVIGITRTPGSLASTGAREVVADVLERDALLAAVDGIKADAVIHQLTSMNRAPTTLRAMRETNRLRTEGTSALIAAARKVGAKKFVAASFFGGYGLQDHGREPRTELAPFGEIDGRADAVQLALLSLEQQVRAFGGVVLRFGLFYDSTTTSVSPVSRTWDGLLPMLHISDAAAATVRALAKYKAGAIYNIADEHPMTYRAREIARARAAGLRPPMRLSDGVLGLVAPYGALLLSRTSITLSTERAATDLGWTPQYPTLAEGLGVAPATEEHVEHLVFPLAASAEEPVPELEPVPEPAPVPEPVEGPEPVEPPKPKSQPKPKTQSKPQPKPGASRVRAPKPPAAPTEPADPFADMDSAIARIGTSHDD
jgi:nucleoside-diphosphate-sugar epimerase